MIEKSSPLLHLWLSQTTKLKAPLSKLNTGSKSSKRDRSRRYRTKHSRSSGLEIREIQNTHFQEAVNYWTYRIEDKSTQHDCTVFKTISEMWKRLMELIKPHNSYSFDSVSIAGLLCNFRLAGSTNGIHEGAVMWHYHTSNELAHHFCAIAAIEFKARSY